MATTDNIADILCYQILDNELHNLIWLGVIFYYNLFYSELCIKTYLYKIIYSLSVSSKEINNI